MHDIEHCVPARIEVCIDCVTALAEGEVIDVHGDNVAAEHGAKITEHWGDIQISLGAPLPETDVEISPADPSGSLSSRIEAARAASGADAVEPFFSDAPCQGCGSQVPGGRFSATAWTPSPFLASMPELAELLADLADEPRATLGVPAPRTATAPTPDPATADLPAPRAGHEVREGVAD